jgi:hypothetical protein
MACITEPQMRRGEDRDLDEWMHGHWGQKICVQKSRGHIKGRATIDAGVMWLCLVVTCTP